MDYDSHALYDRKRRISAKRRRLEDQQDLSFTVSAWWRFLEVDHLIRQSPNTPRGLTLAPRQAVNAEGKRRREWSGMKGHRYPKSAKPQTVKNSQGQTVVVMSQAQRDQALMRKLGMNNADMD